MATAPGTIAPGTIAPETISPRSLAAQASKAPVAEKNSSVAAVQDAVILPYPETAITRRFLPPMPKPTHPLFTKARATWNHNLSHPYLVGFFLIEPSLICI